MGNIIKAQRGTKDVFGEEILIWQNIEQMASELFERANYGKIITPIFEATELFARGVGDSSDIVNKEMYTFKVGGEEKSTITLRPENTAGVARAYIEHSISRQSPPQKFWYFGPMFRYERPQAGRQRQFHQVGVELFGIKEAAADAEAIALAVAFLKNLGIEGLVAEINSLGCKACRGEYKDAIKEAVRASLGDMCEDCLVRYEKNPLRILDCKNKECQEVLSAPLIQNAVLCDFICKECEEHFSQLKEYLDELGVEYVSNRLLVRGLDYYSRSVFEIKSSKLGSQNAILGGGRYDSLVETLGGMPTPAVGWAMGVERLCSLINKTEARKLDYYVVSTNTQKALGLVQELREAG
ncbi:histidyl-tRNA synthetase, partial [Candidatus Gastranaerophilus sp. (ex Termes propinquus)]